MEREFDTVPVGRLVLRLGIPAMAAQLFNLLYSITDRIFVGHIAGNGQMALAAIGVCAPALTILAGFASLVGIGGASVMSISAGRRDSQNAQRAVNDAFLMLVVLSAAVTVPTLLFKRPLLYLLGCSDRLYPLACRYFTIYVLGTGAVLCGSGMNQFVLAQGYARCGMAAVITGAAANILLDALLIYGCGLGIAGAAIASVLAQFCMMGCTLFFLQRRTVPFRIGFRDYSLRTAGQILSIGSMSFLMVALDSLMVILLNAMLRRYGGEAGDAYLSCAAVVQSFMVIVSFPVSGIVGGCGTLYGYYYGAGNYRRLMQVFRGVLLLCLGYLAVLCVCAQMIPGVFVRLFLSPGTSAELSASFLQKYTLGLLAVAVQYAFVDGLTAMGKIRAALPISLFRKLLYIACVLVLPHLTALENIFWAGTISDLVGGAFTLTVFFLLIRPSLAEELLEKTA